MGEHSGDDVLLEAGAHLLHQRRLDRRRAAVVDRAGDRQRQVVEHPVVGERVAEQVGEGVARGRSVGGLTTQQLLHEQVRAEPAIGPAALVGEFGGVLRPALADLAEHQLVGHEDLVEDDLAEVGGAVDERDRRRLHARILQVDDQLAETLALVVDLVARRGAAQHDDPVVLVGARGPDLGALEHPAVAVAGGLRRDRREVAAAVGLAHADAEPELAAADAGQEPLLLRLGAELGDDRARLPIGDPVVPDRERPTAAAARRR